MNTTVIIAKELAKEIKDRFGISACAVPTLYYALDKQAGTRRPAEIDDKLINAYTIVCSGFSITVRPSTISFTKTHDDDSCYSGKVQGLQHMAFHATVSRQKSYTYDLVDPKSIDSIINKIEELLKLDNHLSGESKVG